MSPFWIGLIIGLFLGGCIGVFAMCLFILSKEDTTIQEGQNIQIQKQ